jgi:hypothetical protein
MTSINRRLRVGVWAIGLAAVTMLPLRLLGTAATGQTMALTGTDFFDAERTTGAPRPNADDSRYTVLVVNVDLGDSAMNKQQRRGFWNRFLGQFWKDSKAGSFSITVGGQAPALLYAVVKDANDDQLDPSLGDKRMSPPLVMGPADALPIVMQLDFSDKVESTVVTQALKAAGIVASAAGAGPATILKRIPEDAAKTVDQFLGAMNSTQRKVAPSFQIVGSMLSTNFTYTLALYDAPKSDNRRQRMATIRIRADQFPSLYKTNLPLQSADDLQSSVVHKTLDNKTEKDGGVSIYKLIKDDSIYRLSLSPSYADYLSYCKQLPDTLGQFGFSDTDMTLQLYAFLSVAEGAGKRHDANADVCPSGSRAATMRRLGLPKLAPEDYDPSKVIDREALRMAFSTIATAVARGVGLMDLSRGLVSTRQSVAFLPELPLGEDHEKGGDEIEEFLAGVGLARLSTFDFNGEGDRSGSALLRVYRGKKSADGTPERYKIRTVLDSDYKIQRLMIDSVQ